MDRERSPSSIGSGGAVSSSTHKRRDRIAAQACETCRGRKQRCDEVRPKCSLCQRLGSDCKYREPVPTKKDNTLLEILQKLGTVERKIDKLSSTSGLTQERRTVQSPEPDASTTERTGSRQALPSDIGADVHTSIGSREYVQNHIYTPSTQVMLTWPVIQNLFAQHHHAYGGSKGKDVESGNLPRTSLSLATGIDEAKGTLHTERSPPSAFSMGAAAPVSFAYPSPHVVPPAAVPVISWDTAQSLSKGYFDTFNLLHPIVDEQWFFNHTVGHILHTVDNTPDSALAFLVLALGETALESRPALATEVGHETSGFKDGLIDQPPGLGFFNEARKRLGLFLTEVSIENLQVLSLTALYYASCGRASDCWRIAASAALVCQTLASQADEARSAHDLIRRLVWHCSTMAFYLRAEFNLYMASLEHISNTPGLPNLDGTQTAEGYDLGRSTAFQDYHHSHAVISGLLSNLHSDLEDFQDSASPPFTTPIQSTSSTHTVRDAVEHHKERLLTWRGLLPTNLAWQDGQAVDLVPDNYPSQLLVALMGNIQAALLRSHYHHARYLLYRPYVYRVLHHPASLISEDMSGAAECLRASLRWPVTMEPASTSKRLIPLPFYWSQNVCGVLVLLHLSQQHPALSHIRHNFCGRRFEYDASETVELYIHWLRDLKQIDATAERCWGIVQPLYGLED